MTDCRKASDKPVPTNWLLVRPKHERDYRMSKKIFSGLMLFIFFSVLFFSVSFSAEDPELVLRKKEWEEVREQQIQMIKEKEEDLERLKEEVFLRMRDAEIANEQSLKKNEKAEGLSNEQAAFKAEKEKFFKEINRQKENLREKEGLLEEKIKKFEEEKRAFEFRRDSAGD